MFPDWYAWGFAIPLAAAIGAGIVAWLLRLRGPIRLPLEHVAAVALIGVAGWEILIDFPGQLAEFFSITAGIGELIVTPLQVLVIAEAAYVLASAAAIVGVLRRTGWGIVLGVGVSVVRAGISGLGTASLLTMAGTDSMPDGQLGWLVASTLLRAVPAVAAVVLLLLPFLPLRPARIVTHPPARTPSEGIIDLDPDAGLDEWPETTAPAGGGR